MAGKKGGLGRGLEALFADQISVERPDSKASEVSREDAPDSVRYIGINDIKPNAAQPRKHFDEEKIGELADSIREHGIIQPLVVRPAKKGFELVAGERRWRAARVAGLREVPCLIREFSDEENMLVAIIENMQREDLDPIEEAEGLERMIAVYGLTQEQVSKSVGKSRPYITNSLRLLNLPEEIRSEVSAGRLSAGHARAILSCGSAERQKEIAEAVIRDGLSVRDTEKLATTEKARRKKPVRRQKNREILRVEEELRQLMGTKVNIVSKGRTGAIELEYYTTEDLNRLIDLLRTVES